LTFAARRPVVTARSSARGCTCRCRHARIQGCNTHSLASYADRRPLIWSAAANRESLVQDRLGALSAALRSARAGETDRLRAVRSLLQRRTKAHREATGYRAVCRFPQRREARTLVTGTGGSSETHRGPPRSNGEGAKSVEADPRGDCYHVTVNGSFVTTQRRRADFAM
jgi:hypothetical protein